ncbi:unnamed protein product [Acanthosepion pharaonis]|uniref:DUF5641 domain-containing protein n=1 Tax=Acanthosepion pharaonis TaxID=158019 RepID=A0A812CCN8_ACAPH|nr:unnamed protein product [Sepia pharaonis]
MFLQYKQRLTHELLSTFLAEVTSIVNVRPLISVSTDPDKPFILTPATLLTQKASIPFTHECGYGPKDILRSQWKFIQHLTETFWSRWRREYLSSIQTRTKWRSHEPNLETGNVVLLKDDQAARNEWPLGLIMRVFPSEDNLIRKGEVRISRKDGTKHLLKPVTEIVLLCLED